MRYPTTYITVPVENSAIDGAQILLARFPADALSLPGGLPRIYTTCKEAEEAQVLCEYLAERLPWLKSIYPMIEDLLCFLLYEQVDLETLPRISERLPNLWERSELRLWECGRQEYLYDYWMERLDDVSEPAILRCQIALQAGHEIARQIFARTPGSLWSERAFLCGWMLQCLERQPHVPLREQAIAS